MKRSLQALFTIAVFAAPTACKVSVGTSSTESPDQAKPNGDGAEAEKPADAGGDDGDEAATDSQPDASTTLTAQPAATDETTASEGGGSDATVAAVPDSACTDGTKQPGDTWQMDCNTCQCKEGKVMCTRMKCDAGGPQK
jgi:hypothetical protein